ncbi:serine acetyltransferase [Hymenobacter sp. HD11105]
MNFIAYVKQDTTANTNNTKGKVITLLFRLASYGASGKAPQLLFLPYLAFYRFFVEWVLGVELPWDTRVGPGLRIFHGQTLVVHKHTIIGQNCTLRHSTTIGNAKAGGRCPVIGDNVEVGANVCIIGDITIGNNVVIGSGSVVVASIPANSLAVGNPARVVKSTASAQPHA